MAYEDLDYNADYYGAGVWQFNTDRAFVHSDPTTWPTKFTLGSGPATKNYRNTEWGFFGQDDIRLGRVTLNLGLRYDFDTNLRSNDLIAALVADPQFAGLSNLVKADRGNDLNNIQPRVGFAWDTRGDGRTVLRGGYGLYSGRNRPWFNIRGDVVSNQFTAEVTDPALLQFYPDQHAALGGRTLEDFIRTAGGRALYLPGDDLSLPYVRSATLGVAKLLPGETSLEIDLIHQVQKDLQTGRDANLPPRSAGRQRSAAVPAVLVGDADQLAHQLELRRAAGAVAPALQGQRLAGVVHVREGDLGQHQRQRQLQHRPVQHVRQRRSRARRKRSPARALVVGDRAAAVADPARDHRVTALGQSVGRHRRRRSGSRRQQPGSSGRTGEELRRPRERAEPGASSTRFRQSRNLAPITMEQLTRTSRDRVVDLRATKQFSVGASTRIGVFLEAYNLFNTVNYENPSGVITSGSFASYTTARDARQIQWGARIQF